MVLPGPPSELKPMVMEQVVPILSNNGTKLYSRVLRFFGIGESQLVTILEDIIKNQTDPTIAPYAKVGEVTLRLSTKAENQDEADFKLDSLEKEILALKTLDNRKLKDLLYGYGDNNSMARTVLELLKVQNKTITAAESLTAGLFQSQLAEFSGASQVFNGGFTTYSMEAKSQSGRSSDTMGTKHYVEYGVYAIYGSVNCFFAEKTGFDKDDLEVLKESLRTLFINDSSSARPEGSMEVKEIFWFEHSSKLGNVSSAKIRELVTWDKSDSEKDKYEDYNVHINEEVFSKLENEGLNLEIIQGI